MDPTENAVEENRRLRRTMRDLVALSTLPAIWVGLGLDGIASSLADVLLNTLSLDLVYIRLAGRTREEVIEVVRSKHRSDAKVEVVKVAIASFLGADRTEPPDTISDPFGSGMLHVAITRFGVGEDHGLLITGSQNANFPTESDRLLLGVGANQTAIVVQRRRAEEQSHEQREWLHVTLASIGDAVLTTDTEGRVTFLNSVAESLTGWTNDEAAGRPLEVVFEIINEHTRKPVANPVTKVLRDGRVVGLANHTILIAKDGTERPIDDSAAPIRGKESEIVGCVLVFRDISEKKLAEAEVKASEERFRTLFESMEEAFCVVEMLYDADNRPADYRFLEANPTFEKHTGLKDAVGRTIKELVPDHDAHWFEVYGRVAATGEATRFVNEAKAMGRWYDVYAYRVGGPDSRKVGILFTDITDRKRAETALRFSEQRWRTMAEALPNLVWTDLPDGQCDWLSSQWGRYTGIPEAELLGQRWLDRVIHPDDRHRTLECWQAACEDRGDYDLEYRIRRHDGQYRWFKTRGVPIRDESGRIIYWFGTCTDIEDHKRAEESLRETDRRKDEFLATLAHELRNPLAPIRNSLQILKMPRVDAATVERSRDMMERQVHQLVRLVDDLLDVSRVMRGKIELRRERVELATVVARAVETVQPLLDAQEHQLSVSLPTESLLMDADPVRLAQVIGNLLTNAAKYTEPNGRIRLTGEKEGQEAVLRVRDTGIGIAPDMLPHIFELFVQVDHAATRSQGGLGIGLTLVKNLVGMHHGTVEAHSGGLGQGSEFIVRLPLSNHEIERPEENEEQRQVKQCSGHRLLVVDDNRDAAESLAVLLRLQGHEVQVAHDGLGALKLAEAYRPEMIFLDIGMPGMDGYEVARQLRQQPGLKTVRLAALTGWGQQEDRRRTAEAGFNHHLVKPVEPSALEKLLADLKPDKK